MSQGSSNTMGTSSGALGSSTSGMAGSSSSGANRQDMQQKVQDIKQNVQDLGSSARQMASEQYDTLRTSANDYIEQGRARAMEMERSLEGQIRDQPLKSVLMAAGFGLILGVLWSRR